MNTLLADPVSLIVAVIAVALFLAIMLCDIWVAAGNPPDDRRCPRCRSRHHTDCNES